MVDWGVEEGQIRAWPGLLLLFLIGRLYRVLLILFLLQRVLLLLFVRRLVGRPQCDPQPVVGRVRVDAGLQHDQCFHVRSRLQIQIERDRAQIVRFDPQRDRRRGQLVAAVRILDRDHHIGPLDIDAAGIRDRDIETVAIVVRLPRGHDRQVNLIAVRRLVVLLFVFETLFVIGDSHHMNHDAMVVALILGRKDDELQFVRP